MTTGLNQTIKESNRWICWKSKSKPNGKTDKIPTSPINGVTTINITDFSNAATYDEAKQTAAENDLGLGILLGDGLSCIDLDDCVKEDGISDRAKEIVNQMDTYTEFSPSGLGLHIFYYGEKPGKRCRMKMEDFEIEIYEKERFITVTENMVYGTDIMDRTPQISDLYYEVFGEVKTVEAKEYGVCTQVAKKLRYALSHDKLLKSLWDGQRDEDDESRNDLAIIGKLTYWLNRDPKVVYKALKKSPYFKTKSDKHKDKINDRYDNYFLPSFDKCNDEMELAAWDWQKVHFSSSDDAEVKVDMSDLDEANDDILVDDDEDVVSYPWLFETDKGINIILENIFSEWFISKFNLMCINGLIYTENGEIPDDYVAHKIQAYISPYINKNLARTSRSLFDAVKNDAYKSLPRPKTNLVHVKKHTLDVSGDGVSVIDPKFTINRLNVKYNTEAECPQWMTFLNELLEPEYIPILQEYMGYCLSPTNVAQVACFIIGNGGEGKSIVVQVLQKILGRNQFTSHIHKLSSNNFMLANLENKLLFMDDDINMAALDDTSVFKQMVTNNGEMALERKNKQHHSAQMYAKILACGNGSLRSKYDKSDGFYRRLMILKCRVKAQDRVDDKMLHLKILKETDGIFQWMLEGLTRLMGNGWYFTKSESVDTNIEELKDEVENVRLFLKDIDYVSISVLKDMETNQKLTATIPEIYDCYLVWCEDNSYEPMSKRTVSTFMAKHKGYYGILATNKIKRAKDYKRGYYNIQMKKETLARSGNLKLVSNIR